ncbi:hypothetical protein IE81DRAFT_61632 [Ceraceosorus guamensis]|uniref:Jacalin-type lectin domain-containing protein n=1 Tax=Ceraceosorus guamensis TaxID=1522189 RepID=A0A316W418_9BASI|nr:hypothetical protein IE81DRAFT_61632 [Ceraceosorus guamensis]PWN43858.1 hypothetical protein IE81DRAFT_61632 [Ceraceosorus guamensis]
MGLLLAPYNNAMRLGQGFNSYTHEICIDDAVTTSPLQSENVLTNDGTTMRLAAMVLGRSSAWTKQDQILLDVSRLASAQQERLDKERTPHVEAVDAAKPTESKSNEEAAEVLADLDGVPAAPVEPELTATATTESASDEPLAAPEAAQAAAELDAPPPTVEDTTSDEVRAAPAGDATDSAAEPLADAAPGGSPDGLGSESFDAIHKSEAGDAAPSTAEGTALIEPSHAAGAKLGSTAEEKAAEAAPTAVGAEGEDVKPDTTSKKVGTGAAEVGELSPGGVGTTTAATTGDKTSAAAAAKKGAAPPAEDPVAKAKREAAQQAALKKQIAADQDKAIRRKERDPAMADAADKFKNTLDLKAMIEAHKKLILEAEKSREKMNTALLNKGRKTMIFDIKSSRGVSQTVIYRAEFIDKLSEITNDLGISAALSIQKGSIGGSGKGSFIDTDKFKSSDLNFYISVKVVNQSINFRDCLEYNPCGDGIDESNFRKVFGDSFISGFLEGGELTALVTMKVLNTSKARDISVEGAITVGTSSFDVSGQVAYKSAKANLELNTETTIQVNWLGGGVIKPPNEPWTVESLTRAAARFPDHVAETPQRTYAILTKYESLRSFQALKPPKLIPVAYENAALYTNELLDVFMSYKALYSRLSVQIAEIQNNTSKFRKAELAGQQKDLDDGIKKLREQAKNGIQGAKLILDGTGNWSTLSPLHKKQRIGLFPPTLDGLDAARQAVRLQMNFVINRVEDVTKRPDHVLSQPAEEFLSPFAFETLLPALEPAQRSTKRTSPLTGERMYVSSQEAEKQQSDSKKTSQDVNGSYGDLSECSKLCFIKQPTKGETLDYQLQLFKDEVKGLETFLAARGDGIEESIRLTPLIGNQETVPAPGSLFSSLDFVKPGFLLKSLTVKMNEGVVCGLICKYTNGLSWRRGKTDVPNVQGATTSISLKPDERITSIVLVSGTEAIDRGIDSILSLKWCTNHGHSGVAESAETRRAGFGRRIINGRPFHKIRTITFDSPLERGYVVGFWGRSEQTEDDAALWRLGMVWANQNPSDAKKDPARDQKQALARAIDEKNETRLEDALAVKRAWDDDKRKSKVESDAAEKKILALNRELAQAKKDAATAAREALDREAKAAEAAAAARTTDQTEADRKLKEEVEHKRAELQKRIDELESVKTQLENDKTDLGKQREAAVERGNNDVRTKVEEKRVELQRQIDNLTSEKNSAEQSSRSASQRNRELNDQTELLRMMRYGANCWLVIGPCWVFDWHVGINRLTIHSVHRGANQRWLLQPVSDDAYWIRSYENWNGRVWYLATEGSDNYRGECALALRENNGDEWICRKSPHKTNAVEFVLKRDQRYTIRWPSNSREESAQVYAYSGSDKCERDGVEVHYPF